MLSVTVKISNTGTSIRDKKIHCTLHTLDVSKYYIFLLNSAFYQSILTLLKKYNNML